MNFYGKSLNFKMLTQFVFKHAIDEPKKLKKKDPQNYLWAAWDLDFRSSLAIVWSENQGTGITQELTKNAEFQSHPRPNESEPESESLGHLSAYQRLRHPGLIHLLIKRAAR